MLLVFSTLPIGDALSKCRHFRLEPGSTKLSFCEHDLFEKPVSTFPDHALGCI